MAYWGAHAAALSECAEPLVPFVEALSDGGRQTAHRYYTVLLLFCYVQYIFLQVLYDPVFVVLRASVILRD